MTDARWRNLISTLRITPTMMRSDSSQLRKIALASLNHTLAPRLHASLPDVSRRPRRDELEAVAWQVFGALSPSVARTMPAHARRALPIRGPMGAVRTLLTAVTGR